MALKEYQTSLSTGRLYEVSLKGGVSGVGEVYNASIWSNGTINIYGSNSATQPAALADMVLEAASTNVEGMLVFSSGQSSIPRYIALTGSPTEVVASALNITDLGAIS